MKSFQHTLVNYPLLILTEKKNMFLKMLGAITTPFTWQFESIFKLKTSRVVTNHINKSMISIFKLFYQISKTWSKYKYYQWHYWKSRFHFEARLTLCNKSLLDHNHLVYKVLWNGEKCPPQLPKAPSSNVLFCLTINPKHNDTYFTTPTE